ncbi:DUF421 domain-containing protein [Paenibacillus sp. GCM10027627]|uniref:DUF421 domain-containing protein n=1 Tax=unclassified Paenibacillus TaxID=185978 RepID=UPI00362B1DDA
MPDWLQIILRTLAAIVILFIMTKILGKRQISELSLFEYITGISIGNIAAYISLDLDNLWFLGIVSLIVWVSISVGIEFWTVKSKKARDFIDGKGTVLITDGRLSKEKLKKERLTLDELLEQLRQKSVFRVADVEFAVMESSGELNVQLKKEYQPLTADMLGWNVSKETPPHTVIMDGNILRDELDSSGKDEKWLSHELQRYKLQLKDVLLAQIDRDATLTIQTANGRAFPADAPTKPRDRVASLTDKLREELMQLERLTINDADRKIYQSALFHLQQGIDSMRLGLNEEKPN